MKISTYCLKDTALIIQPSMQLDKETALMTAAANAVN